MNYLSAENISKSFGDLVLFEGLTFGLSKGDKTALIARNGVGKTTLLRILSGMESSDSGEYAVRKGVKTAFLEQAPVLDDNLSIEELIRSTNTKVLEVIKKYEALLEAQSDKLSAEAQDELEEATNNMDQLNAWDYDRRLRQLLDLFRITDVTQNVSILSGGEKKRLALALVLLDEPDLLILDEPTNHLDIDMIEWLEKYLAQSNLTLLMVTHDRYFLDRVCNRILEINNGQLFNYQGNYEYFLIKRAEREEQQQTEADRAGQLMKKELEWLRRMPKARTSKSKSRIDAFDGIKDKANQVQTVNELKLQVNTPRMGGKILELNNITKSFESINLIEDFSYKFLKGDRLGIIGKNGSGKTTLLNIITGIESLDKGNVVVGETIVMAYYRQMGIKWKQNQRVIDAVKEIAEIVHMKGGGTISASKFLEHFMFPPETQYKQISKLSGGEMRRLHLLTVLIKNPNFLILDEPTNDLDLFALNKLEEFLLSYEGCLIVVSHDRYFLDKLTDHLFIFEPGGSIKDYYGKYSSYKMLLEKSGQKETIRLKTTEKVKKKPDFQDKAPVAKTKLTYKEKLEYDKLEPEIAVLEKEKASLEEDMNSGELDYDILNEKSLRVAELIKLIEEKMTRWMELGEFDV